MNFRNEDGEINSLRVSAAIAVIAIVLVIACLVLLPTYSVWEQEQTGKAELARAEYGKRVAVVEAQAKLDSAALLANAEVARADGVARANKIIGDSLKGHDEYLKYLWITQLEKSQHEVIYVPTEAQIPIMEAGKSINKVS